MEAIFIPRMSVLTRDKELFSNLTKFSEITGYVPTPFAHSDGATAVKQGNRLTNLLRTLRNSVLKHPKGNYNIMDNEDDNVMLYSCGVQSELRTRKQFLVEMIKKHEAAMLELRDARIKCWKSMENVERYRLMTETYKSALQHKQHDKNVRTAALQVSRALLDKWKWKHKRHQSFFETKLQEEIKYREEIQKIAKDIETDILEMLDHSIRALMNQNKQSVSDKDISRLSQQLYYQTCRSYRFGITENEPCQKELVQKPTYETSFLNKTDIEKKVKGQVIPIDDKKKRGLFVKA